MSKYIFKYVNEDEFNRCEKTIKKYDSLVYKKLLFSYYPNLKEGNFSGDLISQTDNVLTYSLEIPCTSQVQEKLYGNYKLIYSVYEVQSYTSNSFSSNIYIGMSTEIIFPSIMYSFFHVNLSISSAMQLMHIILQVINTKNVIIFFIAISPLTKRGVELPLPF